LVEREEVPNNVLTLLDWYTSQVSSHVESMVGIFFGLIGSLVLVFETRGSISSWLFLLIIYVGLAVAGFYFYTRLMYFNQMAEQSIRIAQLDALNRNIQRTVLTERLHGTRWRLYTCFLGISIDQETGGYNIRLAWLGGFVYIIIVVIGFIATYIHLVLVN